MEDLVASGAFRRIGTDVSGLVIQLAILQSAVEYVRQVAGDVSPDSWDRVMNEDVDGLPEMRITLRGDQVDSVMRLLAALDTLG
jgi:hypothetical protein